MFCHELRSGALPCSMKWVYEIISIISLICSCFVVHITIKEIKMNLIHHLIIEIIISEIIDEISIILEIFNDSRGKHNFENYDFRMYFCYSQIFLEVFSCLWTLTASLLIALKLYDIIVNKNRIFKYNSFMSKNAHFISIAVPLILSYIFWAIHLGLRANFWDLDGMYVNKVESGTQSARMIFCWLNKGLSIPLAVIAFLLILGNLYFSVFKGFFFLKNVKENMLLQDDEERPVVSKRIKNITEMQAILFLYPIISSAIWLIFFLFIFLFFLPNNSGNIGWSWVFCIFMSIRQTIYISVYFFSQKKLRLYTLSLLCCKRCKKFKYKGKIFTKINKLDSDIKNTELDSNKISEE